MKKIVFLFAFLIINVCSTKTIIAVNSLEIICNHNQCQKSSDLPLFNETNIYPGLSFKSQLTVNNNRNESCSLKFNAQNNDAVLSPLSERIDLKISSGNNIWYSGSLYDLMIKNDGNINRNLGNIEKNTQSQYQWMVVFDQNAGNEFQNTSTSFNVNFNFSCENDGTASNPVSNSNSSPPVCNEAVPDAPTGFYTRRNSTGSVTLFWNHPNSPHTHYLIAYGTSPGIYLYGNPNVGNDDHYTVRDLTYGAQYCFYVRTINACMPGGRTEEKCINLGSTTVPNINPPSGFQPEILGATDNNENTNSKILGATDEIDIDYWWLLLLVPFLWGIRQIILKRRKRKNRQ